MRDHIDGKSRTHIWTDDPDDAEDAQVLGYFTLSPTVITDVKVGGRSRRDGMPGYILCKLAVHLDLKGHGPILLGQALLAAVAAADIAGGAYLVVDPAEGQPWLRTFYEKNGFQAIRGNNRMYINISTIRES